VDTTLTVARESSFSRTWEFAANTHRRQSDINAVGGDGQVSNTHDYQDFGPEINGLPQARQARGETVQKYKRANSDMECLLPMRCELNRSAKLIGFTT